MLCSDAGVGCATEQEVRAVHRHIGARSETESVAQIGLTRQHQLVRLAGVELDAVDACSRELGHQGVERLVVPGQHLAEIGRVELHRHVGGTEQRGHCGGVCTMTQEGRAHHGDMRAGVEAFVSVREV